MNRTLYGIIGGVLLLCGVVGGWFLYSEIVTAQATDVSSLRFDVQQGESATALAERLEADRVIRSAWLFRRVLTYKQLDTDIKAGTYEVTAPITLLRVMNALASPQTAERTITIIPGWDVRDIAAYLEKEEISTRQAVYDLLGTPAVDVERSLEGYLAPDTYRVYKNATLEEVVAKLKLERENQLTEQMRSDIEKNKYTWHEILTMASILEREARGAEDKARVADIFWRRLRAGWALQADSTVHYVVGKEGSVFTSAEDRQVDSPWNTYKYPGLPPTPISNPSLESIRAAMYPTKNDAWFFLTDSDGVVHYARTNDEHNLNRAKYLQ